MALRSIEKPEPKLRTIPKIVTCGEDRIRIEGEFLEIPKKEIEQTVQKYDELVNTALDILESQGISHEDEELFFESIWEIMYSNFGIKDIESQDFLLKAVSGNQWDCDTSAFFVYDVASRFGIKGLGIVTVKEHAFLKTSKYFFETSLSSEVFYAPIAEIKVYYPAIYGVFSGKKELLAYSLNCLAVNFITSDKYEKALEILSEAERTMGRPSPVIYTTIAICYFNLKKPKKALEYAHKALEIDPTSPIVWRILANKQFSPDALNAYLHAFEHEPKALDSTDLFLIGFGFSRFLKDNDKAFDYYDRAIRKDEENPTPWYYGASEYLERYQSKGYGKGDPQDLEDAIEYFTEAAERVTLDKRPRFVPAESVYFNLATCYRSLFFHYERSSDLEKAMDFYQIAFDMDPDYSSLDHLIDYYSGELYYKKHYNPEKLEEILEKGKIFLKGNASIYETVGTAYFNHGEYSKALKYFKKALGIARKDRYYKYIIPSLKEGIRDCRKELKKK